MEKTADDEVAYADAVGDQDGGLHVSLSRKIPPRVSSHSFFRREAPAGGRGADGCDRVYDLALAAVGGAAELPRDGALAGALAPVGVDFAQPANEVFDGRGGGAVDGQGLAAPQHVPHHGRIEGGGGGNNIEPQAAEDERSRFLAQPVAVVHLADGLRPAGGAAGFEVVDDVAVEEAVGLEEGADAAERRAEVEQVLDGAAEQDEVEAARLVVCLDGADDGVEAEGAGGGDFLRRGVEHGGVEREAPGEFGRYQADATAYVEQAQAFAPGNEALERGQGVGGVGDLVAAHAFDGLRRAGELRGERAVGAGAVEPGVALGGQAVGEIDEAAIKAHGGAGAEKSLKGGYGGAAAFAAPVEVVGADLEHVQATSRAIHSTLGFNKARTPVCSPTTSSMT